MSITGKIKTLFSDPAKTQALFPRTKVKAISDDNNVSLEILLGEKVTIEKLWENASPTSTFNAQEINVNLTGYDLYIIMSYFHTTVPFNITHIAKVGNGILIYASDYGNLYRRNVNYDEGKLTFSTMEGTRVEDKAVTTNNEQLVPVAIYGIKGVS